MKPRKINPKYSLFGELFAKKARIFLLIWMFIMAFAGILLSNSLMANQPAFARFPRNQFQLLQPAPTQPVGYYDYFGKLLSPKAAAKLVKQQGLNPGDPISYQKVGAVQITQELIDKGEDIYFNRKIGDTFGLQGVFGFAQGFATIVPEIRTAIAQLGGQPTTNLQITLQKDIVLGSRHPSFPAGKVLNTGLKVEKGGTFPLGFVPDEKTRTIGVTCAACHATVSNEGKRLAGIPNGELAISLLIALSPNTSAGFARLNFDPLDPQYQGNGKTIIDSKGQTVKLPDPEKFEKAFDDAVLDVPFGNFESSPDSINNTTQIPSGFTFKNHPYLADGQFAVGPFAGLSVINNAVHSSEINLLAAAQLSQETLKIDPEVYIGTFLQNAADERLRLPDGVKPSVWLRQKQQELGIPFAELEDQIPAPGAGNYPNLRPSLVTYNGLFFSPNSENPNDIASGKFFFANNAMSAFQNSLVPPANRTHENWKALKSGSVRRGARVFQKANCATCHIPPFFTDNTIHPLEEIGTNSARAKSRLGLNDLLVEPKLYTFDTTVPVSASAEVLDVPTQGISESPTTLPKGILPNGGYKTTTLRGLYFSAPYLHDGGVAVREGSLNVSQDGIQVVDPSGLGLTGTLSQALPADPASSLRALLDRELREQVVGANKLNPALSPERSNLDGTGHEFYVDNQAGFNPQQQTDLINFLLALDDDPGNF